MSARVPNSASNVGMLLESAVVGLFDRSLFVCIGLYWHICRTSGPQNECACAYFGFGCSHVARVCGCWSCAGCWLTLWSDPGTCCWCTHKHMYIYIYIHTYMHIYVCSIYVWDVNPSLVRREAWVCGWWSRAGCWLVLWSDPGICIYGYIYIYM